MQNQNTLSCESEKVIQKTHVGGYNGPRSEYREKSLLNSLMHQGKMETAQKVASGRSIHMNGRVYDYNLGRFLSVDPYIQGTNSQAINPYSYIQNNPLSGTDPSGYLAASNHNCQIAFHTNCDGSKGSDPNGNNNNNNKNNKNTTNGQTNQQQSSTSNSEAPTLGEFLEFVAENFSELWSNATELTNEQYFGDSAVGDVFIDATDPVGAAIEAAQDVQDGNIAGAVAGAIAKKIPGGKAVQDVVSKKVDDVAKEGASVIGRVKDLQKLNKNEKSLLDRLPDQGSPKANWKQNSGVLRQEMNKGKPIRDVSPGDTKGQFLNAERSLLESRGWTFDRSTNFWNPPKLGVQ